MEEARELAVVSSDFTDRFVSAYNKFTYVASATIFICVLDVSESNTFFGFDVDKLNERSVEVAFFVATLALGLNYLLRVFDERRVLSNLEQEASKSVAKIKDVVEQYSLLNAGVESHLEKLAKYISNYANVLEDEGLTDFFINTKNIRELDPIERISNNIVDEVYESKNPSKDKDFGMENVNNFHFFMKKLPDKIDGFEKLASDGLEEIRGEADKLSKLPEKLLTPRISGFWPRLRYVIIDLIFPATLFLFTIWAFLVPNKPNAIITEIGQIKIEQPLSADDTK